MELTKYPVERLFSFIAGIIPGFVALLIYQLAVPGSFGWFFTLGFLGYRTKLALILLTAFVIGNSMATFVRATMGAVGGVIGTRKAQKTPFEPAHQYRVAPWRDARWRGVIRAKLGSRTPNDTRPLFDELLTLKRQAIDLLPPEQRQQAHANINLEKLNAEIDDGLWG